MTGWRSAAALLLVAMAASACGTVTGTPTWPGARLRDALLTAADFPAGVRFDRIREARGPDGQGGLPAMMSEPAGCVDGLTQVIADSAERGPGAAEKYAVAYDGARVVMTVLASPLDLDRLEATATRCHAYLTYFDKASDPIPITTTKLPPARPDSLLYQQSMTLQGAQSSVYFAFENVGESGMFGIAFPTPDPTIAVKGTLPQTFLDIVDKQAIRLR